MNPYDDGSPIPTMRSAEEGFLPDEAEVPDEVTAMAALLANKDPLPEQLRLQASGGWLAPESDRSDSGGIPIGMPVDKVGGQQVRLIQFDENGGETQIARYSLDGLGDPIVREVFAKYALQEGETRDVNSIGRILKEAMREVQARKLALKPKANLATQRPSQQGKTMPEAAQVEIVFNFGGVDGSRRARYAGVTVEESLLVLVADDRQLSSGVYEPPNLGPEQKFEVVLPGLPEPVRVFSCGLKHGYGGNMFYLLFIDR